MARVPKVIVEVGEFERPDTGPSLEFQVREGWCSSGGVAWQSNGGLKRGHKARTLPFTLEIPIPSEFSVNRVHLVGVFARFADRENEAAGCVGASLQVVQQGLTMFRMDLINGIHYDDAAGLERNPRTNGDGSSVEPVGKVTIEGSECRVDVLTVDIPGDIGGSMLRFKDLGTPASFAIFDVFFEGMPPSGCPFHSQSGGVALGEISSIVRLGDRVRFSDALEQVEAAIHLAEDMDEARGQALTFLAMVTAATLEMGGSRSMHRIQLEAARALDQVSDPGEIFRVTKEFVAQVASPIFQESPSPSAYLVDRALAIVDRQFAKNLTDASVASQLGLSNSHFRYLFKEATGQPFHKYLIALRLEKARRLLADQELAVSAVAKAVGFTGLSHFSRAFAARFSVSPTHVRRGSPN